MRAKQMRAKHWKWPANVVTLLGLMLPCAMPLSGQGEEPARGQVVIGVRYFVGDPSSSKFSEYRHIPRGLFIQSFRVNLDNLWKANTFLSFQTRETLEKDQSYLLSLGSVGKYRFEFRWDQTPHAFTNTARGFFLAPGSGLYSAPTAVRTSLQSSPGNLRALLADATPLDVSLRRNTGNGRFIYTPKVNWNLQLQYSREKQNGVRPFGTTTNSFTNIIELPEPIDYRTHQLNARAEYANRRWGIQFGYNHSFFINNVGELRWDNPFRSTDAVNGASRGQLDLYPDNSAYGFNFAGAVNLGDSTRFIVSIVPGWMRQNDPFLPFTVNTALPTVPALPAASLNGEKQTLAMNYTLASNIIPALRLTARYRSYDYNNNTASFVFSDYVRTDASLGGVARRSLPYGYDRKNLGWEASWEFFRGQFWKVGYEWERFDRQHRDVELSNEHTVNTALDLSPSKRVLFRVSYQRGDRSPKHYEPNEESFPLGEPATALGQLHELRKFDEAARVRNRADAMLQLDITDQVSFAASYGTTQDNYHESLYGLLSDINFNYGFELTYSPREEVSFFTDYTREKYNYSQRSRQRVPRTATAPVNDSPNNDWESGIRDIVDTWGAGLSLSFFRKRLLADTYYSLSAAKGLIRARALGSSTIPGFLVTTAVDYPDTGNRFHQVNTAIRCRLSDRFSPRFDYRYERYSRVDFQIDRMNPYMVPLDPTTNTSIFLGADVPPYNVHILAFSLEYRF